MGRKRYFIIFSQLEQKNSNSHYIPECNLCTVQQHKLSTDNLFIDRSVCKQCARSNSEREEKNDSVTWTAVFFLSFRRRRGRMGWASSGKFEIVTERFVTAFWMCSTLLRCVENLFVER